MVTAPGLNAAAARRRQRGALATEVVVAMALLTLAIFPIASSFHHEVRICRAYYYQAVAMGIVDGEMEVLAAGAWRAFPSGRHDYPVRAAAASNLPPGAFVLTVEAEQVRLEWQPRSPRAGKRVARTWALK